VKRKDALLERSLDYFEWIPHNASIMSAINLQADARTETGRKTYTLREAGKVPAVVYGAGTEPQKITIDRNRFVNVYKEAGESSVVELAIDQKSPLHVLIQDFQLDPLRDEVIHVDFRSIDMNKVIEATVDLEFVGESAAVKALGGTFVPNHDSVTIRCLPSKLMRNIQVNISLIKTFEDAIRVSDLFVPEGIEILDEANVTLASVAAPRSEEEMAELDKTVELDVTAVQVEKKEKEEEEEEAEVAAPAGDKKE
jgi:large subunit ribosomal protein L25